ncbi:MAG: hypothetical protein E7043_08550 [Lentisphaerae bacterium]|nr:hypothetical protein [Lentisphaerota bacterium]
MASDFHSHFPREGMYFLRSGKTPVAGELTSLEFHPWFLPDEFVPEILPSPEFLSRFCALGEIGLDKLRGPQMEIQQKYLYSLLALASDTGKPVVIHAVRSFAEVFRMLKHFNLKVMFHGFRSSPEMLDELWKRNFTVSFHPSVAKKMEIMLKLKNPSGAFGFESDNEPDMDIRNIIKEISEALSLPLLEQITDQNFADFTGI